jgi:hypothetical protein
VNRVVFILNGKAGSGKDTFVELQKAYAQQRYRIKVRGISTVDKVKEAARLLGWDGVKVPSSRKFLSDLKDLSTKFCDGPAKYCYEVADTLESNSWLYIHCREPDEIDKMQKVLQKRMQCFTVFIRRPGVEDVVSNHADLNVEKFNYDFYVDNNSTLEIFAKKACDFVDKIFYLSEE